MAYAVRVSDLNALSKAEKSGVLKRLADEAARRPNGQRDAALARVRFFEKRHGLTSEQLLLRLKQGKQHETAEIADWLFNLKLLSIGN